MMISPKEKIDQKVKKPFASVKEKTFYIAGIGASAGGLEAFEKFFKAMPENSGIGFIVVSHLDPSHVTLLPELIQKYTEMKVLLITDGLTVEPDTVYIAPPMYDLGILSGVLHLIEPMEKAVPRLCIDSFFKTLAQDQKEKAIGIILSGMGADGTAGLKEIKNELGLTIAQSPETASASSMPTSAIRTGIVDIIASPENMPEKIITYTTYAGKIPDKALPVSEAETMSNMQKIYILLRKHTGHDFSNYKQNTIFRRIERRMAVHHIEKIQHYIRYLQENPKEIEILFKELLIGVTGFFRDSEAFESLKNKVLSGYLKEKPNDYSLRIWVPGCSTGEEVYSIAIIVKECMELLNKDFNVQIFGTDIDADAIETARLGIYPLLIANDVGHERLQRFFTEEGNSYRINKSVREMIVFAPQNIIKEPPFTKLDLLSCRNLLIYLNYELQKKIYPLFHYALKPNGILFLGTSETIGSSDDMFASADKKHKIYIRKDAYHVREAFLDFPLTQQDVSMRSIASVPAKPAEISTSRLVEKVLLETYSPSAVLTDQKGKILYFHGRTGKYLEPAPGDANMNIFEMAREGIKTELSVTMRKALSQKKSVVAECLTLKVNGGSQQIDLNVIPVNENSPADSPLLIVAFKDIAPSEKPETGGKCKSTRSKTVDKRIAELEKTLQYTKENLQTTIEELETSNEELKSANEELQSTNEELQSANEELETSKEEQQSLNEELITVNAELQNKLDELARANNDMRNLLDSVDVPTVFLDNRLCISRFTLSGSKIANLIRTDIGRPISDIASNLNYDHLVDDAREVLRTLVYKEHEVQSKDGHWYLLRIMPYRTTENVIEGLVITLSDIHHQKLAHQKITELNRNIEHERLYAESIVNTIRESILVFDRDMKVVTANRSFYETFRMSEKETKGKLISELGAGQWDISELRKLLEKVIAQDASFDDYELGYTFPDTGRKKLLLNARKIKHPDDSEDFILLVIAPK